MNFSVNNIRNGFEACCPLTDMRICEYQFLFMFCNIQVFYKIKRLLYYIINCYLLKFRFVDFVFSGKGNCPTFKHESPMFFSFEDKILSATLTSAKLWIYHPAKHYDVEPRVRIRVYKLISRNNIGLLPYYGEIYSTEVF